MGIIDIIDSNKKIIQYRNRNQIKAAIKLPKNCNELISMFGTGIESTAVDSNRKGSYSIF